MASELDSTVTNYVSFHMGTIRAAYTIQKLAHELQNLLLPEHILEHPNLGVHDRVFHAEVSPNTGRCALIHLTDRNLQVRFSTVPLTPNQYNFPSPARYPEPPDTAALEYNYELCTIRKMVCLYDAVDNRPNLHWHPDMPEPHGPATIHAVAQEIKLFLGTTQ